MSSAVEGPMHFRLRRFGPTNFLPRTPCRTSLDPRLACHPERRDAQRTKSRAPVFACDISELTSFSTSSPTGNLAQIADQNRCLPRQLANPVHFPGFAPIRRERLFHARRLRRNVEPDVAHQDGAAMEVLLVEKLTAIAVEASDDGWQTECPVVQIDKIDTPLARCGIVQTKRLRLNVEFLSTLVTSNSSKFALLSRTFLWFEMPSYSTHVLELLRRSGSRRT